MKTKNLNGYRIDDNNNFEEHNTTENYLLNGGFFSLQWCDDWLTWRRRALVSVVDYKVEMGGKLPVIYCEQFM